MILERIGEIAFWHWNVRTSTKILMFDLNVTPGNYRMISQTKQKKRVMDPTFNRQTCEWLLIFSSNFSEEGEWVYFPKCHTVPSAVARLVNTVRMVTKNVLNAIFFHRKSVHEIISKWFLHTVVYGVFFNKASSLITDINIVIRQQCSKEIATSQILGLLCFFMPFSNLFYICWGGGGISWPSGAYVTSAFQKRCNCAWGPDCPSTHNV